jgi:hypothetical protein
MRIAIAPALFAASVAAAATIAACSYAPNPESGTLMCGPNASCPENYACLNQYCWRDGDVTGVAGSAGGAGGRGGAGAAGRGGAGGGGVAGAGGAASAAKFIGRWTFIAPATRTRVCGGVTDTEPWTDFFDVEAGGVSVLATFYYCDWNLDLNTTGTSTSIRTGSSCSAPDPNTPTTTFTWRGEAFTLTTTDGVTGTMDASLPYTYVTSAGQGSCTMRFTGPVRKN